MQMDFKVFGGLCSNIGHGLFVGWVEHPDSFVGFLRPGGPTYVPAIFFAVSETQRNG